MMDGKAKLNGVGPVVPTPFLEDGRLDLSSTARLAEFLVAGISKAGTILATKAANRSGEAGADGLLLGPLPLQNYGARTDFFGAVAGSRGSSCNRSRLNTSWRCGVL